MDDGFIGLAEIVILLALSKQSDYWGFENFPFWFFHSDFAGMGSMVSQCSAIFPLLTRNRS